MPPAPAPNAGGDQFLCGASAITLNGNAVTNGTNSWRFYNTTASTTPVIAPVGNDLNVTGMTENGVYRFIYSFQNPPCTALEDTVEVTVSDETVPGAISGPTEFCGSGLVTLGLTGNLGQVLRWEKSANNFATVTNIANTTTNLIDFISQTTQYRAVVQNPGCGIELTAPFRVRIDQPSQGGTLNFYQYSSNNICGSNISGVLYLYRGMFGNVEHWEYLNSKTTAWDSISNGNYYLNVPSDLPFSLFDTTSFRVSVKSGICPSVYSNVNIVEPKVQGLDFDTLYAVSGCDGYAAIKAEAGNGSGDYDYFISPSAGFQQSPGFFNYVQTNRTYTVYARDRNTLCYTQKTITVTPASVQPPQVFSARNVTSTSAVIEWLRVPGFNVTYELRYRRIGPIASNPWTVVNVGAAVSYQATGLDPGTKYVFRIRAICRDGSQSMLSDVADRPEARFTTLAGRGAAVNEVALNSLSVYPNPNNGAFTIDLDANAGGNAAFVLTDVAGKRIYSQKLQVEAGRNEIPVALDNISSGVYILRYQQGKTVRAVKLIVE